MFNVHLNFFFFFTIYHDSNVKTIKIEDVADIVVKIFVEK